MLKRYRKVTNRKVLKTLEQEEEEKDIEGRFRGGTQTGAPAAAGAGQTAVCWNVALKEF